MGDDFFEDQPKEAPSKSNAPKKNSGAVKKPAANKGGKPGAKAVAAKAPAKTQAATGGGAPQQVDLLWTVALVVVAFVVGFFIRGLFIPPATTLPPATNNISTLPSSGDASGGAAAPALTEEQAQSGQLPQGHPSLDAGAPQTDGTAPAPDGTTGTTAPGSSPMGNIKSDVPAAGELVPGGQSVDVKEDPDKKK